MHADARATGLATPGRTHRAASIVRPKPTPADASSIGDDPGCTAIAAIATIATRDGGPVGAALVFFGCQSSRPTTADANSARGAGFERSATSDRRAGAQPALTDRAAVDALDRQAAFCQPAGSEQTLDGLRGFTCCAFACCAFACCGFALAFAFACARRAADYRAAGQQSIADSTGAVGDHGARSFAATDRKGCQRTAAGDDCQAAD
jgi:hypothetical protein